MNDLEDRLRADLLHAVGSIDNELDADRLLASAHRVRDARRIRRTAGVVAFSLLGGLVFSVATSLTVPFGIAPVIATPGPVPTTTPSSGKVPTQTSRDWSGYSSSVTFDTSDASELAGFGLETVAVTFRGEPGRDVVVSATRKSGTPISDSGAVTAAAPFLAKLTDKVWVMITHGKVRWAEGAVAGGITSTYVEDLDGLGVILVLGEPRLKLEGFIWQGLDGMAWNDRGERAPSAEITLGDKTYWFAHDSELGVACSGLLRVGEGNRSPDECGTITSLGESGSGGTEADGWYERLFVVLPEGATEVTVDARQKCTSGITTLDPGGRTVVLLRCEGAADEPDVGFPGIRYRNAAGDVDSYFA